MGAVIERWKCSRTYEWLRLKGYAAFNVPRTVTALGAGLLGGIAATHVYLLISRSPLPEYFYAYTAALTACCLLIAASLMFGRNPRVPQIGWLMGDLVCVVFLGLYLATRAATLSGLVAVTGRWDVAPGTFAAVFAVGFIAVHISVLLGINVAYPQRQQWSD